MDYFSSIYSGWRDLMDNKSDPRTRDWLLMSSPFPTIAISLCYAYFVKVLGPKIMEDRKPFQIRGILILYNFIQVCFSTWLFYEASSQAWFAGYSYRCEPVDYSNSPTALKIADRCWWYYFSKFTEFFDTIFFILRKRYDQVSTLHVIHHGIMPVSVWWGVKFTPGGHSTFFGFLNTFVHIFMYTYYMLAAMGPKIQKYLWWKKYLTVLQMIQFVLVMIHSFQLFFSNECNYPIAFAYFIGAHAFMFYFLFSNFYKQAYVRTEKKLKASTENGYDKTHQNGYKNGQISNGYISNSETHITNGKLAQQQQQTTELNGKILSNTDNNVRHRVNGVGSYL